MKIMCIGDVVGKPGRSILRDFLPQIRRDFGIDFVVANGENAAGGSGITRNMAESLTRTGVDAITLGDHIWDQRCFEGEIDSVENLCRPANIPPENPGKKYVVIEKNSLKIGVFSLLGQTLMKIKADCPFRAAAAAVEELKEICDIVILDFHAETTSEKISMGNFLDGKATVVFGTHTHVPTADAHILPMGTAYISDLGMTGPWDGCLGRDKNAVLQRFLDGRPRAFNVAEGEPRMCGCIVEIDDATKKAVSIESFIFPKFGEKLPPTPEEIRLEQKRQREEAEKQNSENSNRENSGAAQSQICENQNQ